MSSYYLAPALEQLRDEINARWPHRDKASDGWIGDDSHAARPSDHNPDWSDGGIVRAIDVDEDLAAGLTATGEAMPLVDLILSDVRTRYVIYEGRIWTRDAGRWAPYSGPNAHRHHVHVSVRSVGTYDRDASPWGIANLEGDDDMALTADDKAWMRDLVKYHPEISDTDPKHPIRHELALERLLILARRNEAKLSALSAAVRTLAQSAGLPAGKVEAAIDKAVADALSDVTVTLTTK